MQLNDQERATSHETPLPPTHQPMHLATDAMYL